MYVFLVILRQFAIVSFLMKLIIVCIKLISLYYLVVCLLQFYRGTVMAHKSLDCILFAGKADPVDIAIDLGSVAS